jgi:DNA polymerase
MVRVTARDYGEWRRGARHLLASNTPPERVLWTCGERTLPLGDAPVHCDAPPTGNGPPVPRRFVALAQLAALHRDERKWSLLYRLLWRVVHEGRELLDAIADVDVRRVTDMAAQVRRDEHKMRAFVRFTPVAETAGTRYVAWYEPDHPIVRHAAPFFADRFNGMRWSILTPDLCAHWDGSQLSFSGGMAANAAPRSDGAVEQLWRTYYESIFNPARLNVRAMQRDMPVRRWKHLPEAALIPALVATAHERTARAVAARSGDTARAFVPVRNDLDTLRHAAASCRGCPLFAPATQVVFGEGPPDARIVLVGEQPGDAEDRAGRPFVGPAGQVLDRALAAAGIPRDEVYITNAVKHFSFEPRGKRRIHQTPRLSEMQACRPWLEAELQAVRPATVVALGSTAARALLGPQARVMAVRGRLHEGLSWAPRVVVTVHPSAVLRSEDDGGRYFEMLVGDLSLAGAGCARVGAGGDG